MLKIYRKFGQISFRFSPSMMVLKSAITFMLLLDIALLLNGQPNRPPGLWGDPPDEAAIHSSKPSRKKEKICLGRKEPQGPESDEEQRQYRTDLWPRR